MIFIYHVVLNDEQRERIQVFLLTCIGEPLLRVWQSAWHRDGSNE